MIISFLVILLIAVFWNGLPSIKSEKEPMPISWKHLFQQDEDEEKPVREPNRETLPVTEPAFGLTESISVEEEATTRSLDISNEIPNEPASLKDGAATVPKGDMPEDFITLKKMLEREHGATEVLLEPWGREGKMYRFSCCVARPKGSGVKKVHQSIQATPMLAIQKVMEALR